jgi:hypothetical protein
MASVVKEEGSIMQRLFVRKIGLLCKRQHLASIARSVAVIAIGFFLLQSQLGQLDVF